MRLSIRFIRRIVQVAAISILTLPLFFTDSIWLGTYLSSQFFGFALTDPLAAGEVIIAGQGTLATLLISVIPLLIISLIFGRVFCSWVCPLNTIFELGAYIHKPKTGSLVNTGLPFLVLGFFLSAALLSGLPLFTILSPIGIISRSVTFGVGLEILFVLMLFLIGMFYAEKAWCRTVCPVGALYGLIGRFKLFDIAINQNACNNCGQCHANCTMGTLVGSHNKLDKLFCTNCGDCISVCPQNAVRFHCTFSKKGGVKNEYHSNLEG